MDAAFLFEEGLAAEGEEEEEDEEDEDEEEEGLQVYDRGSVGEIVANNNLCQTLVNICDSAERLASDESLQELSNEDLVAKRYSRVQAT